MKIAALKRFAAGVTLLALMGSATAFAQQSNKPNILSSLRTTSATVTSVFTAAGSCAAPRRHGSMNSPLKDCG